MFRFLIFDPYLTFAIGKGNAFVAPNGKLSSDRSGTSSVMPNAGGFSLLDLGREAFSLFSLKASKEEFEEAHKTYCTFVKQWTCIIKEMHDAGTLKLNGNEILPGTDWSEFADAAILDLLWQIFQTTDPSESLLQALHEAVLLCCFEAIDGALVCMCLGDLDTAISESFVARKMLEIAKDISSKNDKLLKARSALNRDAAQRKHKNSPQRTEKEFVYACWQEWQRAPERYRYKAEFARDMLEKCEHLKSQKKIEEWCRAWGRGEKP